MGMPIITPSTTSRSQAITDIIESVALEETALSHILNAEGEKLQKVIAISTTSEQLLSVNKSVEKMVDSVAMLEMVLKSKLELFDDCLCPPTSSTTTTTTTSTTTTTTTTTCAALTNMSITTSTGATITKSSNTLFSIDLTTGTATQQLFTIVTTPAGLPINFVTLPAGTSQQGASGFMIDKSLTLSGTIVFTVGTGACMQTVTVNYATAV